uniref:Reverse transcriptase RNase H-like domain-containing protein n=1 Tax=Anopheles christyi TaxID=43041 RepID=A0A182KG50_9DIPT
MQRAVDTGVFHPCYYFSRLMSLVEENYHSFDLESLPVVESLRKFRCYLFGKRCKVVTDCIAFKQSIPNARTSRWLVVLSECEYDIEHRSVERMWHVDALLRANSTLYSLKSERIQNAYEQGHFGSRKVGTKLEAGLFIPGLEDTVGQCISSRKNGNAVNAEGELHPVPTGDVIIDTFHIDHLGPMPSTRKFCNFICRIVDAFTKFVWCFPIKII